MEILHQYLLPKMAQSGNTDRLSLSLSLSLSLRYPRLRLTKHLGNAAMHFIYSGGFLLGTLPRQ